MEKELNLEVFMKKLAGEIEKLVPNEYAISIDMDFKDGKDGTKQPSIILQYIDDKGNKRGAVFYCAGFYHVDYIGQEHTIEEIALEIYNTFEEHRLSAEKEAKYRIYEHAKTKLYAVLNAASPEMMRSLDAQNIVYRKILDMVVTYAVMTDSERNLCVDSRLVREWGIMDDQLFRDTLDNYCNIATPELHDVLNPFGCMDRTNLLEMDDMPDDIGDLLFLGDTRHCNSAAVVLSPEVMEKVGKLIGHDFYLLPSSKHEMLIPDVPDVPLEELLHMVVSTNRDDVEACDRLTDSVYRYRVEEKTLELVATAKESDWEKTYSYLTV